jgi:hypothetical protein
MLSTPLRTPIDPHAVQCPHCVGAQDGGEFQRFLTEVDRIHAPLEGETGARLCPVPVLGAWKPNVVEVYAVNVVTVYKFANDLGAVCPRFPRERRKIVALDAVRLPRFHHAPIHADTVRVRDKPIWVRFYYVSVARGSIAVRPNVIDVEPHVY